MSYLRAPFHIFKQWKMNPSISGKSHSLNELVEKIIHLFF